MKRKNATRSALFMSVISMLLCVSMLVGTTFAWFTDEVKSGVNTIAAGNLDVELYHGKNQDPVDKVNEGTLLFTDVGGNVIDVWEPGVVAFTNLKVANVGTLALKYQLSVNSTKVNYIKDTDISLANALKVAVVEGGVSGDRAAVIAAGNEVGWEGLKSFTLSGVLEADKKSETYGIVVYWQPGNNADDNVFNMNNGKTTSDGNPLTITLGVNLFATQEMYEDDSFGPDYDKNAWDDALLVTTEADLIAALANGAQKVKLGANVVSENGFSIAQDLAINLNGYTMTATGNRAYLFNVTGDADLTVVNGTLVAESTNGVVVGTGTSTGASSSIRFESTGTLTVENVKVRGSVRGGHRAIDVYGGHAVLKNVDIESSYGAGVVIGGDGVTAVLTDCDIVVNGIYSAPYNSVCFGVWGGAEMTVNSGNYKMINNNTYNTGDTHGGWVGIVMSSGGTLNINGGLYTNVPAAGFKPQYERAIFELENNAPAVSTLNLLGGTFDPQEDQIYGGYGDQYYPTYNVPNLIDNGNGTWTAAPVGVNKVIATAADLQALSAMNFTGNNGTAESYTIMLGADIDMNGAEFSAMIAQRGDTLTFLGNGHTISNVNIVSGANDNTTGQASLFYAYPNSTLNVSDLTIKDITITADANGTGYAAAVVGYCEGAAVLDNVDVVNATIVGVKSSGALVGHLSGSLTATNCDVSGTVTLADFAEEPNGHYAGKYLGTMAGATALNNCTANVTVSGNLNAANDGAVYGRKTAAGSLTIDGAAPVSTAEELVEVLKNGGNVVLTKDVEMEAATTAPYGNKVGVIQNGGVIDGDGNELVVECYGDDYGIMTSGGTIKNLTIEKGTRAVMIMYATEDIILDNVKIGGDGVLYPINTGEYATVEGVDLIVTNSVLAGWTSFAGIESASFTNVEFKQGTYYNNIYGRVLKPYVNTTLTDCSFVEHMNLDLSGLVEGQKVTINNCTVNGQPVTADVFTIPTTDAQYDTELFTVDLPSWATSIDDCIVFE